MMKLKSELRASIKTCQATCTPSEIENESKLICTYLSRWFDSRDIQHVGIYMAMPDEINLGSFVDRLLAQGEAYMPPNISQQIGATLFVKLDLTPFYKQVNSIYLNHLETQQI